MLSGYLWAAKYCSVVPNFIVLLSLVGAWVVIFKHYFTFDHFKCSLGAQTPDLAELVVPTIKTQCGASSQI